MTGDPPITNEDRSVAVVLNGEIYNFRELRDELRGAGHEFGSEGDTEVIAHLAEDLPPVELARRLDGMSASPSGTSAAVVSCSAAIAWARSRSTTGTGPTGASCSAARSRRCWPIRRARELNPRAIPAYLTFGYVPTPRAFRRGQEPAARPRPDTGAGAEPVIERYWEPPLVGSDGVTRADVSLEAAAREVRRLSAAVSAA